MNVEMAVENEVPLVRLKNAGVTREGRWLVRGVDLSLRPREIVTLVGPNGSGKSTTAKMALGIWKPDEGEVVRPRPLSVGYVPQSLSIDWTLPLSVERFLSLTSKLKEKELHSALEQTGTRHLLNSEVRTLSGGEFQRVLLARAISKRPQLLVLDEPVQGVDINGEVELYKKINEVRDEIGCAILMISHDLHIVMSSTDRVLCLNNHVCCSGSPKSVATSPQYQALFGRKAGQVLAVYEHDHDHTHLPDGRVRQADGTIVDGCAPTGTAPCPPEYGRRT